MRKTNGQKGAALVLVLMVSVAVAALSTTFVLRSLQTSRSTRSNLNGEKAVHIAEAGLDLAIIELVSAEDGVDNDDDGYIDESDESDGVVSGVLAGGTYTVQATFVATGLYTLVSTATYDGITRIIELTVLIPFEAGPLDPPAALTIVNPDGVYGLNTNFSGNAFSIVGYDTNISGTSGSGDAVCGIGVFDNASVMDIISSLNHNGVQDDNINGIEGAPSIANISDTCELSLEGILDFAADALLRADILMTSGSCNSVSFGTNEEPLITYVGGDLTLLGNCDGAGILIVDGSLDIRGGFEFNGLVIMTGSAAGNYDFGCDYRGNFNIHGAVIICNPLDNFDIFDFRGNVDVRYSTEGLGMAQQALGAGLEEPAIISWRRIR